MVPGSFPPKYAAGYLNSKPIQLELDVPLNFSGLSYAASDGKPITTNLVSSVVANSHAAFTKTGDFVLGRNLAILGNLLDQGVKVALMYGDADYQCNCGFSLDTFFSALMLTGCGWTGYGGEKISLAIESKISKDFRKAGYAEIKTDGSHVGGFVRQHGALSFSRVLDAGHEGQLTPTPFVV